MLFVLQINGLVIVLFFLVFSFILFSLFILVLVLVVVFLIKLLVRQVVVQFRLIGFQMVKFLLVLDLIVLVIFDGSFSLVIYILLILFWFFIVCVVVIIFIDDGEIMIFRFGYDFSRFIVLWQFLFDRLLLQVMVISCIDGYCGSIFFIFLIQMFWFVEVGVVFNMVILFFLMFSVCSVLVVSLMLVLLIKVLFEGLRWI